MYVCGARMNGLENVYTNEEIQRRSILLGMFFGKQWREKDSPGKIMSHGIYVGCPIVRRNERINVSESESRKNAKLFVDMIATVECKLCSGLWKWNERILQFRFFHSLSLSLCCCRKHWQ